MNEIRTFILFRFPVWGRLEPSAGGAKKLGLEASIRDKLYQKLYTFAYVRYWVKFCVYMIQMIPFFLQYNHHPRKSLTSSKK